MFLWNRLFVQDTKPKVGSGWCWGSHRSPLAPPQTLPALSNQHFHCSSLGDMGHESLCFNKAHCVKSLHWGFKTMQKCHSKSRKQWAIISLFLWPMEQAGSKKTLFLYQFMSQTTRGCKRSPFCYGISQALRTLAPSAAACPFPPTCPIKRRQPAL